MSARDYTITTEDGFPIVLSLYSPKGGKQPRAVVILSSAMGAKRQFYAPFAEFLAEEGFAVVSYDYRGIGDSRPKSLSGFVASIEKWGRFDFEAVIRWAMAEFPNRPLSVIGHSVGAQIVGLAPSADRLAAMAFVAAGSGYFGHWPGVRKLAMASLWTFMPVIAGAVGYLPGKLGTGQDLPRGVASEWARWGRKRDYLAGRAGHRVDDYARLSAPLLALSFSDDGYAPLKAVNALLALYSGARVEHRHVEPSDVGKKRVQHFGFFRAEHEKGLWRDVAGWLGRHVDRKP